LAKDHDANELHSCLNKQTINAEVKIETVKSIFKKLNIDILTENEIDKYYNISTEAIQKLNVPTEKLLPLRKLAEDLMNRKS